MVRRNELVVFMFAGLLGYSAAWAADFKSGQRVSVAAGDTLHEDLYCSGQTIEMLGTARRDLVVAGQRIEMDGSVAENFYGVGQTVRINGKVLGDISAAGAEVTVRGEANSGVRAAGGVVAIGGRINGDVVIAGGKLVIEQDAEITGDVVAAGGEVQIAGLVRGKLRCTADRVDISGQIEKDAMINLGKALHLASSARIGGDLTYRHSQELDIDNAQTVTGQIIFEQTAKEKRTGGWWLRRGWFWLSMLAVGMIMLALAYPKVQNALFRTAERPLATLGFGALVAVGTPFAILFTIVTILLIPLGLIIIGAVLIIGYLAMILSGTFLGRELLRLIGGPADSLYVAMLLGVSLLMALSLIPVAGVLLCIIAVIAGIGMIALGLVEVVKQSRLAAKAH